MKKGEISQTQKIFMIINTIVIASIVVFYLSRLFIYKAKFEKRYSNSTYTTFNQMLINNLDLMAQEDGLFKNEDGSYSFRGNANNNYCLYCNQLYRIVRIESDGRVILISEKGVTSLPLYEYDSFQNSNVYTWLNDTTMQHSGIFEATLVSKKMYLTNPLVSYEQLASLDDVKNTSKDGNCYVTICSVYDYLDTVVNNKSFLNNGEAFWLSNIDEHNNYYYVDEEGSIGVQYSKSMSLAIRPMIALNYNVYAQGGQGSKDDPYRLNEANSSLLKNAYYGSYVKYDNYIFRICDFDKNNNVVLILDDVLYDSSLEKLSMSFGKFRSYQDGNAVFKYLNNNFLKSLTNYEEIIVKSTYYKGTYGLYDDFSYLKTFEDSYEAYVGIPNVANLYLNDCDGYYLSMNYAADTLLVYIYGEDICHADYYSNKNYLRPVITVKGDIALQSGSGLANDPYVISTEVTNETSE